MLGWLGAKSSRVATPHGFRSYCALVLVYFMCIYTLICYFTYLNSPVFFGPTPIVPEGAEHRLGGLHPGAPYLASLPAAARASPPAYCACRHWASRTRAVSLLTGGLIPQLALYLIKRNPPKRSIVILHTTSNTSR